MVFRNIATAFLENSEDMLLMKRAAHKTIAPGYWFGVGGHVEPQEINHPQLACEREIQEETGIKKDEISNLKHRYIIFNKDEKEVVINHIFTGEINTRNVKPNSEGTLHWVPRDQVLDKTFIPAIREVLRHYLSEPYPDTLIGIVQQTEPLVFWYPLQGLNR